MMTTSARVFPFVVAVVLLSACGGNDGGGTWKPVDPPSAMQMALDVWAFSASDVWVVDGSATVRRFDGTTWSDLSTAASSGVTCIFALSPTDVWLCAQDTVLHYDGAAFTALPAFGFGLDGLTSIWATSASSVWAVGDDAIVARYNGTSWSAAYTTGGFNSSIWGSSATDIYVLGTFALYHHDGGTWSEVEDADNISGEGEVWGTSASDVWVMADSTDVAHFDGTQWETFRDLDIIGDLAAVWGSSSDNLWAVGSAGQIAHFDGSAWSDATHQPIGAPYLQRFFAVHGSSASDVWAVGQELGNGGSTALVYRLE